MKSAMLQQKVENEILQSYQSLYRLAYSYVKNPDDAMDIVQESAYKAILHSDEMRNQDTIKGWLCRIVVNTSLDLLRRLSPISFISFRSSSCSQISQSPLCFTPSESGLVPT